MRTPGVAWSGSGGAAASAGEGLVGDSTGTACCARSGVAQRAVARNAADTRALVRVLFRECVMMLPRLSGQGASALVTSRKLVLRGDTSIAPPGYRWREAIVSCLLFHWVIWRARRLSGIF